MYLVSFMNYDLIKCKTYSYSIGEISLLYCTYVANIVSKIILVTYHIIDQ